MKAEEALSVAKTYVNQTLVGMGALKGAPCTIKSQTKSGRLTTTVFEWTDTDDVKHESTMLVYDGENGADGADGKSAYQLAVEEGYIGTEEQWLASLHGANGSDGSDGADGKSAYQLAVDQGYVGTLDQWLASLHGADGTDGTDGASAYEIAVDHGYVGTEEQWLASLHGTDGTDGTDGKSAYQLAVDQGYVGTLNQWLASLHGADGNDGADGFSPTIVVKSSTSTEYILTITDKNGSYDTPNLKGSGGGGGGASVLSDLTDVQLTSLASGDALIWNGSKWVNLALATVATTGDYTDLSNKPTLGTAAALDVPASGDASTTEVVKGDDSRLTDARTPLAHTHTVSQITDFPTLGTAAAKDVPASGDASSTEVVMGDDSRLSDSRTPTAHTHTVSQITDFPTLGTAAAKDSTNAVTQSSTDLVESGAVYTALQDKADKVTSATSGNFAGLDANGNLTDSGSKASDFLTSHQDITGKADKVQGATNGDFAGLDSNGNLTDSGKKASDFANAVHTHTVSQITDFPSLGTAAALNVAASGDAATTEVVKGDDSRLTDARTPLAHTHTVSQITDFPSLATVAISGSYNDLSNKPTIPDAVTIGWTGTASASGVRYQRIGIGGVYTEIAGTKYMEQTQTTDTSNPTNYTFTHADITANSSIEVEADTFGITPSSVVTTSGQCVVTIPAQSTAFSLAIRIWIK